MCVSYLVSIIMYLNVAEWRWKFTAKCWKWYCSMYKNQSVALLMLMQGISNSFCEWHKYLCSISWFFFLVVTLLNILHFYGTYLASIRQLSTRFQHNFHFSIYFELDSSYDRMKTPEICRFFVKVEQESGECWKSKWFSASQ